MKPPVCHVCGKPATKRMGPDLVEPDSGIRLCDDPRCKEKVTLEIILEEMKDNER